MNKIEPLIKDCREMIELLERDGNENWAQWFGLALKSLEASDVHGCKKILGAYGGMGSFNDFRVKSDKGEIKRQELSGKIYALASELWKENS